MIMTALIRARIVVMFRLTNSFMICLSLVNIMSGMFGTRINPWVRRIIIRVINVAPTSVMILLGFNPLDLLVYYL